MVGVSELVVLLRAMFRDVVYGPALGFCLDLPVGRRHHGGCTVGPREGDLAGFDFQLRLVLVRVSVVREAEVGTYHASDGRRGYDLQFRAVLHRGGNGDLHPWVPVVREDPQDRVDAAAGHLERRDHQRPAVEVDRGAIGELQDPIFDLGAGTDQLPVVLDPAHLDRHRATAGSIVDDPVFRAADEIVVAGQSVAIALFASGPRHIEQVVRLPGGWAEPPVPILHIGLHGHAQVFEGGVLAGIVVVQLDRHGHLVHVAEAGGLPRAIAPMLQNRHHEPGQHGDDGDGDEQLDECEPDPGTVELSYLHSHAPYAGHSPDQPHTTTAPARRQGRPFAGRALRLMPAPDGRLTRSAHWNRAGP